jgi:hypothetical protein
MKIQSELFKFFILLNLLEAGSEQYVSISLLSSSFSAKNSPTQTSKSNFPAFDWIVFTLEYTSFNLPSTSPHTNLF